MKIYLSSILPSLDQAISLHLRVPALPKPLQQHEQVSSSYQKTFNENRLITYHRSLEQLKESTGTLKGAELTRLQRFCVYNHMCPKEHLIDSYGRLLRAGNVYSLRRYFENRVSSFSLPGRLKTQARSSAADELYRLRYGPTRITIFNVLLAYTVIRPRFRKRYLQCAAWLVEVAKVPVDGQDLSGTTVLTHAISTHPYLDLEFAGIMLKAGSPINHRNRYGYTAAHDIANVVSSRDEWERLWSKRKAIDEVAIALKWFVKNDGNIDIKDGNEISARHLLWRLYRAIPDDLRLQIGRLLGVECSESKKSGVGQISEIARNHPCPCGSGRKFKRCCGSD